MTGAGSSDSVLSSVSVHSLRPAGPGALPPISTPSDGGFIRTSKQLAHLFKVGV